MTSRLPETIEPFKLAERRLTLSGTINVSRLQRLLLSLASPEGDVGLLLDFYRDEVGRPVLRGNLTAELTVCCQRCLQNMPISINADVHFALQTVRQSEKAIPEDMEVLVIEDSSMSLNDFVEDEIILALPLVAMHELDECSVKLDEEGPVKEEKPNPFAVLADLKPRK